MSAYTVQSSASSNIQLLKSLRELWFHTGTACNLNCPFCLEGSGPGDSRLQRIKLDDIKAYIEDASRSGVERFGFTGGEPLIVKDIIKILEYALALKPCVLLTNGTAPLIKRAHQLELLKRQPNAVAFWVSIDYPDEQRHDAGRGMGNFRKAMEGIKLLHDHGFAVSLTRQVEADENTMEVEARFRSVLRKFRLSEHIVVGSLPDFGVPGIRREAAARGKPESNPVEPMCSYSRMIVKQAGAMRVYACPFVDDDLRFDLGADLATTLAASVQTSHHRCETCCAFGAGCRLAA